jgi:hypothetical protein
MMEHPPDPMTHHSDFTDQQVDFVRKYMANAKSQFLVVIMSSDSARNVINGPTEFTQITLTIRKAMGFAPFIGPPFDYYWYCAIDDADRWISGPVWAVERIDDWMWANPGNRVLWARTLNDIMWRHHDTGKEPQG